MIIEKNTPIGTIVRENFKTAKIFEKYRIDFCCGGSQALSDACHNAGISAESLLSELQETLNHTDPDAAWLEQMALDRLCTYILERHHRYVRDTLPFLKAKLTKLCEVHGENHPELYEVRRLFEQAGENLSQHMLKEERILFPAIAQNVLIVNSPGHSGDDLIDIQSPIDQMEEEHRVEGDRFETIAQLTENFTAPPDGCNTYRVTYQTLREFEQDLHRHIHLENNLLFKKAVLLGK
ncbi:MAG TPA: iron-sulfur cluster repair di-iron protein [Prolixibacteraceae bacterium]|nr:iron-sulfur cluster repair di-iron protein [Prolixibacteraceae bacterium]